MKKIISAIVLILIGAVLVNYFYGSNGATDHKNATYGIDGESVTLTDGSSETAIPGSTATVVTRYFGNEVRTDLNDDGRVDVVFLLTQQTGGTGTFYYVVAALDTAEGVVGSEGFLLGDRIAPQTTEAGEGGIIIVNYADRNPGESFAVQPTRGKSAYLRLDPETLRLVEVPR
ncbi:MAG TPA: hypothetical protein VJB15_12220 [Rhodothermia bacterium]|nr:hypothetical protein [Rhodothermia bacterium]